MRQRIAPLFALPLLRTLLLATQRALSPHSFDMFHPSARRARLLDGTWSTPPSAHPTSRRTSLPATEEQDFSSEGRELAGVGSSERACCYECCAPFRVGVDGDADMYGASL